MAAHVRGDCWHSKAQGAVVFDYGNNLRQRAFDAGVAKMRFQLSRLCSGVHPAPLLRGLRAPSGGWRSRATRQTCTPSRIEAILELFPEDAITCRRWITHGARNSMAFQGLARPDLLVEAMASALARAGLKFNRDAVARW